MHSMRLNTAMALVAAAGAEIVDSGRMTSNRSNLVKSDKPYVPPKTNTMVTSPRSEIDVWNAAVVERKRQKWMNKLK